MKTVVVEKVDAWAGITCPVCGRNVSVSYVLNPALREVSLHGPGKSGMFCEASGWRVVEGTPSVETPR